MCLVLFAWNEHPRYALVLGANRDELFARPTAPAARLEGAPGVIAGRDLAAGGTWLGVTEAGRFAAITNFREPDGRRARPRSRGELVMSFLQGDEDPARFAAHAAADGDVYGGFNLLVGDRGALWYASNRGGGPRPVAPGVHGLSNHLLDSPWPKVRRGRAALGEALASHAVDPDAVLAILEDRTVPADEDLPDTGVGIELERLLAPARIEGAVYGTRSSTVLLLGSDGTIELVERTHDAEARGEVRFAVATDRPRRLEERTNP